MAPSPKQRAVALKRNGLDDDGVGAVLGLSSEDVRSLLYEADPDVAVGGAAAPSASIWVDWDTSEDIPAGELRDLATRSANIYDAPSFEQPPDPELFGLEDYSSNKTLLSGAPFDQQVTLLTSGLYLVSTYISMGSADYAGEVNYLEYVFPGPTGGVAVGAICLQGFHGWHADGSGSIVATEQVLVEPRAALVVRLRNPTEGSQSVVVASSLITKLS